MTKDTNTASGAADLPEALTVAVACWFAKNTGLGGCSDKDVRELAGIFRLHTLAAGQTTAAQAGVPPNAITAAIVRDDGGEAPAFCLMAAYRSEKDAMDAFALIAAAPAQPAAQQGAVAGESLVEWAMRATPEEFDTANWGVVHKGLLRARKELEITGVVHSWIGPYIDIARQESMKVAAPAQPAVQQPHGVAYAALPDEREAFEAMMRSQTFDSLKRLSDGSYESYEARVGWLAWNVRASQGQAPAGATLPDGWVPLTITHEGQHPEEVAYGPQIMMDRLGKWLGKYFAQAAQAADSVTAVEREQERIAFKDAHRHLELYEVPDAWGRPMFKHSHVEASWLGWIARASHGQAPAPTHEQIAAYLESTGAYVTNDATREAAIAEAIDTDRAKRGQAPDLHPKTSDLVQRFAAALAEKLSAAENKYGYSDGWASPNWMDECRQHLSAHIAKGDPRDVAAYCAFLWHHGATTASPQAEQQAHHEEQPDGTTIPIDPSEMAPQQPAPAPMSPANRLVAYSAATRLRELGFEWDATAEAWLQPAPSAQAADSVQEDAARYRWLREGNDAKHGAAWYVAVNLYGCEWDAAIDAAMNKGGAT